MAAGPRSTLAACHLFPFPLVLARPCFPVLDAEPPLLLFFFLCFSTAPPHARTSVLLTSPTACGSALPHLARRAATPRSAPRCPRPPWSPIFPARYGTPPPRSRLPVLPSRAAPRCSALTGTAEPLGPALPSPWSSPQPPALPHWTELSRATSSRQAATTAPWSAAALLCLTEPHAAPPRLLHGAIHLRHFLSSVAPPARPQRIAGPPVPSSVTASASAPSAADFPPVAPPLASELIAAPSPSSRGASSPPACS
ncbi:uncharacterized protein [Miscanthus floridulus]|uniref:uncharacterized protein n=1 Tax=Miscanthus floridulus TaxID=154761 RepID=UPI003457A55F